MNGRVIPNTPIAVDSWFVRTCQNSRLFFLSHAHADHTVGLTSSWKTHKIYCSEITKKIVMHKLGVSEDLLVALSLDEPVMLPLDETGKEMLTVTLIDANHCPGAVMFLFEGYFGRVFYTGDFRFDKSMQLQAIVEGRQIDKLFLDNTYSDPSCVFPSRRDASHKVLDIICNHLEHDIVIGLRTLGKEDLLVNIAIGFNMWIGVTPQRMELLKLLSLPDVFTCDMDSTRIRVVNAKEINKASMEIWNKVRPTIAILPTALFEGSHNPYKYMCEVFVVPYSDHSSFEELRSFVSEVRPKEIIPLVRKHRTATAGQANPRANMGVFSEFLSKEPLSAIVIPESVKRFMGSIFYINGMKRTKHGSFRSNAKRQKCRGVVFDDDIGAEEKAKENSSISSISNEENRAESENDERSCTDISSSETEGRQNTGKSKERSVLSTERISSPNFYNNHASLIQSEKSKVPEVTKSNRQHGDIMSSSETGCPQGMGKSGERLISSIRASGLKCSIDEASFAQSDKSKRSEVLKSNNTPSTPSKNKQQCQHDIAGREGVKDTARKYLEYFKWGNYEDEHTKSNPRYKAFLGRFCEHLETTLRKNDTQVLRNTRIKNSKVDFVDSRINNSQLDLLPCNSNIEIISGMEKDFTDGDVGCNSKAQEQSPHIDRQSVFLDHDRNENKELGKSSPSIIQCQCVTSTNLSDLNNCTVTTPEESHSALTTKGTVTVADVIPEASPHGKKAVKTFVPSAEYVPDYDWFSDSDSEDTEGELERSLKYRQEINSMCPSPEYTPHAS